MFWQPFLSLQLRPTQVSVVVHNTARHCNCISAYRAGPGNLLHLMPGKQEVMCTDSPGKLTWFCSWLGKTSGDRGFLAPCMPVPCAPLECKLLRQTQTFPFGFNLLGHVKIPSILSAARFYHEEVNENAAVH